MNNEPLGYFRKNYDGDWVESEAEYWDEAIPLYTHPVKEHDLGISHAIGFDDGFKAGMQRAVEMNVVKELTDEEIMDEWWHLTANGWEVEPNSQIQFARAIEKRIKNAN